MKRSNKKLQFNAHSVRALVAQDLGQVAGASVKCAPTAGPVRCTGAWSTCANDSDNGSCYDVQPIPPSGSYQVPVGNYSGWYC